MKISIFYSWQSDLPNNKNRGLINNCIEKATKQLLHRCSRITAFELEMDSRNESGTPDLIKSIFDKINSCDIFIADISIINSGLQGRPTPNPNVILELGYAAKALGWSNIICIYNSEFAKVEDLPFDIRTRIPLIYNSKNISEARSMLTRSLSTSIKNIINMHDREEYLITKRAIDIKIQSVLIDFCRLLYESTENTTERFNYHRLLSNSIIDIKQTLKNRELLGFNLFKNVDLNINELIHFFKDDLETYFLLEREKRLIAKMVFALRSYNSLLHSEGIFVKKQECTEYIITSGYEMNPINSLNSYLLLEPSNSEKAVVISGGDFAECVVDKLLYLLEVNENHIDVFSRKIHDIVTLANEWIKITGNYFIANTKALSMQS